MSNKCVQCQNCHNIGWSKPKGNILITIILAFFFLIPAIIYEIWRRTGLGNCIKCGSALLVPATGCDVRNKNFQMDWLFVIGVPVLVIGGFMALVLLWTKVTAPTQTKDAERTCQLEAMKYYQSKGEFPFINDAKKTSTMSHIEIICRGNTTGHFKP